MDENLVKSLTDLIDETIAEIEEIKKSERFSASEIKLAGPGTGIDGKPSDGKLGKEEDGEDESADDEDEEEKKKKEEAKKNDAEAPAEMAKEEDEEEKKKKAKEEADAKEEMKDMKKSAEQTESLFKSFVEERVAPLESKLEAIFAMVKELADAPVPARGVTARMVPLAKSAEVESAPLSKSDLATRLFELKKSGTSVDSMDIARVETGGPSDLTNIALKYNLK